MGTKPKDIADILAHLIESGNTPGCTIWLCQVADELRRARAEIMRLRARLGVLFEGDTQ